MSQEISEKLSECKKRANKRIQRIRVHMPRSHMIPTPLHSLRFRKIKYQCIFVESDVRYLHIHAILRPFHQIPIEDIKKCTNTCSFFNDSNIPLAINLYTSNDIGPFPSVIFNASCCFRVAPRRFDPLQYRIILSFNFAGLSMTHFRYKKAISELFQPQMGQFT